MRGLRKSSQIAVQRNAEKRRVKSSPLASKTGYSSAECARGPPAALQSPVPTTLEKCGMRPSAPRPPSNTRPDPNPVPACASCGQTRNQVGIAGADHRGARPAPDGGSRAGDVGEVADGDFHSVIQFHLPALTTEFQGWLIAILIMDEMGTPGEGTRPTRWRFCGGCRPGALTRRGVTGP